MFSLADSIAEMDDTEILQVPAEPLRRPVHVCWQGRLPYACHQLQEFVVTPENMARVQEADGVIGRVIALWQDSAFHGYTPPPCARRDKDATRCSLLCTSVGRTRHQGRRPVRQAGFSWVQGILHSSPTAHTRVTVSNDVSRVTCCGSPRVHAHIQSV